MPGESRTQVPFHFLDILLCFYHAIYLPVFQLFFSMAPNTLGNHHPSTPFSVVHTQVSNQNQHSPNLVSLMGLIQVFNSASNIFFWSRDHTWEYKSHSIPTALPAGPVWRDVHTVPHHADVTMQIRCSPHHTHRSSTQPCLVSHSLRTFHNNAYF